MKVQREYKNLIIELETLDGVKVIGRVFERIPCTNASVSPLAHIRPGIGYLFVYRDYAVGKSIEAQLDPVIEACTDFVDLLLKGFTLASQALDRKFGENPFPPDDK